MAISVIFHIGKRFSPLFNLCPRDMKGTLILHTILGKDHFIAISGEYRKQLIFRIIVLRTPAHYSDPVPSCYGNKLETLIRLPGPIRTLESPEELLPENHSLNAPREVMRLVNRLMSNNEPQEDLFVQLPDEEMITVIREVCDSRSFIQYQ